MKNNLFKTLFILLFISYITIYIFSVSGYYEYNNYQKMTLTKEQIKQFEDDVKNGKEIDIEDYLKKEDIKYNNKIANTGKGVSKIISNTIKTVLTKTFTAISDFIEE